MVFQIEESWDAVLQAEYEQEYFKKLGEYVSHERALGKLIFPPKGLVFNALVKTALPAVKVVIMGQDPYHGIGQAHGLSFSVPKGIKPPPSLVNVFKELVADVGITMPNHGCLEAWAEQGVLLLNSILTVEAGLPLAHQKQGWERFTDAVIKAVAIKEDPVVFLLWGRNAKEKCAHVRGNKSNPSHQMLTAAHPSPFSAHSGFFGCRHFSKANEILQSFGKRPINWQI